jgi:putative flippase GtrA
MIWQLVNTGRAACTNGVLRHYGGFALAGSMALATDAAVLTLLTRLAGLSPFLARPVGIAVAMVVSWMINRTVTFKTEAPPSITEFSRFAGVSITSQLVNYAVFAAILLAFPAFEPLVALLLACLVSMFVSYTGFRFGVFRRPHVRSSER